jgi:hypothetical protein
MEDRFVVFTAATPIELVARLNEELEDLGQCVYFGKGKIHWIAVFDLAPMVVTNSSDIDNSATYKRERREFLTSIEDMPTANSA